jgi:hypothetical protein
MRTLPICIDAGGFSELVKAYCLASDNIGDAVRVSGNRISDFYQVTRVDINSSNPVEYNSIGVIVGKDSATVCIVRTCGIADELYTGLSYGLPIFVDTAGRLSMTRPANPSSGTRALILMGTVLSQATILMNIQAPVLLRP